MRFTTRAALAVLAAALAPLSAQAAESFDNCKGFIDTLPATIATQGVWCLRKDLATAISTGAAITVATNNVTIDCNGYKVGGLAAGPATEASGIYTDGFHNVTVRRCNVRGFVVGVSLGGDGQLVERNRVEANTHTGIEVYGNGNVIRANQVNDTGGRPGGGFANGIVALGVSPRVIDNDIHGVHPAPNESGNGTPFGMDIHHMGIVRNNRITGLVPTGASVVVGLRLFEGIAANNTFIQPAGTPGYGINGIDPAICHDNVIVGFATATLNCSAGNNGPAP